MELPYLVLAGSPPHSDECDCLNLSDTACETLSQLPCSPDNNRLKGRLQLNYAVQLMQSKAADCDHVKVVVITNTP